MPLYAIVRCALPAGSTCGNVNVACCLSASTETAAASVAPAAVAVTLLNVISAAFSVIVFEGSVSVTSIVSSPVNVAAFRSGVRDSE
jgi:hypothetical protein